MAGQAAVSRDSQARPRHDQLPGHDMVLGAWLSTQGGQAGAEAQALGGKADARGAQVMSPKTHQIFNPFF